MLLSIDGDAANLDVEYSRKANECLNIGVCIPLYLLFEINN